MQVSMRFLAAAAAATLLLAAACAAASNVHEELSKSGLPPGLLPDSVVSYSIGSNGKFEVELDSPCYITFTDLTYYKKNIKGRLSYGSISDLDGIEVKKVFAWFPIHEIVADSGGATLDFGVGFLHETLPWELFKEIPHCRAKPSCSGFVAEVALPISETTPAQPRPLQSTWPQRPLQSASTLSRKFINAQPRAHQSSSPPRALRSAATLSREIIKAKPRTLQSSSPPRALPITTTVSRAIINEQPLALQSSSPPRALRSASTVSREIIQCAAAGIAGDISYINEGTPDALNCSEVRCIALKSSDFSLKFFFQPLKLSPLLKVSKSSEVLKS